MNLTAEQAAVVRAALDARQPYAALVVKGDVIERRRILAGPLPPGPANWGHRPPADWVALTKCQTCLGVGSPIVGMWRREPTGEIVGPRCSDCRDGRPLVEFTEACSNCAGDGLAIGPRWPGMRRTPCGCATGTVPLAKATVEVLPVLGAEDDIPGSDFVAVLTFEAQT